MAGHQEDDEVKFTNAVGVDWADAEQSLTSKGHKSLEPGSPEPFMIANANTGDRSPEPDSPEPNDAPCTTPLVHTLQSSPEMPVAPLILRGGPSHPHYNPEMSLRHYAPQEIFDKFGGASVIRNQARLDAAAKFHWTPESKHHPLHGLTFRGTFDDAIRKGSEENKLVLVILHEGDPVADVNRGSWNLTSIKKIIESNYIVWQEDRSSEEGITVAERYNLSQFPSIAVIDPVSGNKVIDKHGKLLPPQTAQFLRFSMHD